MRDAAHQPRRNVPLAKDPDDPFPIRYIGGKTRDGIVACTTELVAWVERNSIVGSAQKDSADGSRRPEGTRRPLPARVQAVRHFMMADLGLSGLPLLVYARIFGFCDAGCGYFESKGGLARFSTCRSAASTAPSATCSTGASSRNAACTPRRGHATKRYRIVRERLPPGARQPLTIRQGSRAKGDEMTGFAENKGDEPSGLAARTPETR